MTDQDWVPPGDRLIGPVYDELRRVAQHLLGKQGRSVTLQATAVVHEAYLRLAAQLRASYRDEQHFAAIAALTVRRVVVDLARKRRTQKRGGDRAAITLHAGELASRNPEVDVVDLHEALEVLAIREPRAARVVELKFFGGLSLAETSAELEVSTATVERDWRYARAWLQSRLVED